ncbi:MAG: CoA transferase [Chloroflexi bacterium]|nr:CoA transferase [Chloroflexota bacterium]
MSGTAPKILEGARVLDLTDESGVFCTKLLAGLGADVVIVEKPTGSPMRRVGPFYDDDPHPEKSIHWFVHNLNKRSITLDIERADGQSIFKELVRKADFVVECFPPGYLAGLGLDYPDLKTVNPGIVHVSITPFGRTGPYHDYRGCDLTLNAMGGLLYQCGSPDSPPAQTSVSLAYPQAGAQAAVGSLLAYYHRLMSGQGQHVDVSTQECVTWSQKPYDVSWKAEGTIASRGGDAPIVPGYPRYRVYFKCRDGWIASMPTYWSHRGHLREWLAAEGLAEDLYAAQHDSYFRGEAVSTPPAGIEELVYQRFEQLAARYDKEYLYREGQRRGMQVTPMNAVNETMEDEQLRAREYFIAVEHPELGATIVYPGAPFKMSQTPWHLEGRAPFLGEHNGEIYLHELGMSEQQLATLKELGVI